MKKLYVPIITPFNPDETVNYSELKRVVKGVLAEGADGIFAGGSSAECFMLTADERKRTLEAVIEAADGAEVIAHVGAIGNRTSADLARHAKKAGATAIASVPPFYFGFRYENIREYYWTLADDAQLPTMIYYLPSGTKLSLCAEQMTEIMQGRDNIVSLKYTDSDYFVMQRIKQLSGKTVLSGKDECFLSAIVAGADGGIGTTFNFMVGHFARILALVEKGEIDAALKVQSKINAVVAALLNCSDLFHATKYLLERKGYRVGGARKPFLPMTEAQKKMLADAYDNNAL